MSTELAVQMPDVTADVPVASFLSPKERQEDVRSEIATELLGSYEDTEKKAKASDLTSGYGRDGFKYEAGLKMTQPLVLQQVLNNEKTLEDVAKDPAAIERLDNELAAVQQFQTTLNDAVANKLETPRAFQSTLTMVLNGDLNIGDADRASLRNISLQLGNLYAIPASLANSMRNWTMNENRDMNGGPLQQMVADNFAARQSETGRVNINDKVMQNGGVASSPLMTRDDINAAMKDGPDHINAGPIAMAM